MSAMSNSVTVIANNYCHLAVRRGAGNGFSGKSFISSPGIQISREKSTKAFSNNNILFRENFLPFCCVAMLCAPS